MAAEGYCCNIEEFIVGSWTNSWLAIPNVVQNQIWIECISWNVCHEYRANIVELHLSRVCQRVWKCLLWLTCFISNSNHSPVISKRRTLQTCNTVPVSSRLLIVELTLRYQLKSFGSPNAHFRYFDRMVMYKRKCMYTRLRGNKMIENGFPKYIPGNWMIRNKSTIFVTYAL